MKAHTIPAALLGCTLCLGLLAGCGGSSGGGAPQPEASAPALVSTWLDVPPKEGQILADLNRWEEAALPDQIPYTGCEVIKRQSNPEDKEDIVYCSVTGGEQFRQFTRQYQLLYIFYDEGGWILEEATPYHEEDWQEVYLDAEGNDIMESIIWLDDFTFEDLEDATYLGQIDGIHYFSALPQAHGATGVYNENGECIITLRPYAPSDISEISKMSDGSFRYVVRVDIPDTYTRQEQLLNEYGDPVSDLYDWISPVQEKQGTFLVELNDRYGLMDDAGNLLTEISYEDRYDLIPNPLPDPPQGFEPIPLPQPTGNIDSVRSTKANGVFDATLSPLDPNVYGGQWSDIVGPDLQPLLDVDYDRSCFDTDNYMILIYWDGEDGPYDVYKVFQLYDFNGNCRSPKFTRLSSIVSQCHLVSYEGRCGILPIIATDEEIYYAAYEWAAAQNFT